MDLRIKFNENVIVVPRTEVSPQHAENVMRQVGIIYNSRTTPVTKLYSDITRPTAGADRWNLRHGIILLLIRLGPTINHNSYMDENVNCNTTTRTIRRIN